MKFLIYKLISAAPRRIKRWYYTCWNRVVFHLAGVKYQQNMQVFTRVYLRKHRSSSITIGKNFLFTSDEGFNPLCRNLRGGVFADADSSIQIGDNVGMSSVVLRAKTQISIRNNVKIGGDSILIDTDAHSLDYRVRHIPEIDRNEAKSAPIVIEDDVLIGARCIILKGVTIGARSVIGAGSVVTKSIPPDSIAAGNPCRVIAQLKNK